jgi:hypothetical protein
VNFARFTEVATSLALRADSEVAKLVDNATLSAPWWLDFDNNPRGQLWGR